MSAAVAFYIFKNVAFNVVLNTPIKILDKKEETEILEVVIPDTNKINGKVVKLDTVRLGSSGIGGFGDENEMSKVKGNGYESSTEIVKSYSLYAFALLCVIMSILVMLRKLEWFLVSFIYPFSNLF